MSLSRRLRNIAKSQLNALKERLDRVDAEEDIEVADLRARRDAIQEIGDPTDLRPTRAASSASARRTPEEIAAGIPTSRSATAPPGTSTGDSATRTSNPLSIHYRRLGLDDGTDLAAIEAAYASFAARCAPDRFPEGSEDQKTASEIFRRVEESYNALREQLDPTAGRFDKLEL